MTIQALIDSLEELKKTTGSDCPIVVFAKYSPYPEYPTEVSIGIAKWSNCQMVFIDTEPNANGE